MRALPVAAFLLVGCGQTIHVSAPTPTSIEPPPAIVQQAFNKAAAMMRTIGIEPEPWDWLRTQVIIMPADYIGPDGRMAFYAEKVMTSEEIEAAKAWWPNSIIDGHLLMGGFTRHTPWPAMLYAVDEGNLAHEFLHEMYYRARPAEMCLEGSSLETHPGYVWIGHGGPCDPLGGAP